MYTLDLVDEECQPCNPLVFLVVVGLVVLEDETLACIRALLLLLLLLGLL
jgi:hypothetical protein